MANFSIDCVYCHLALNVPQEALGRRVRCPRCQGRFYLPNIRLQPAKTDAELASLTSPEMAVDDHRFRGTDQGQQPTPNAVVEPKKPLDRSRLTPGDSRSAPRTTSASSSPDPGSRPRTHGQDQAPEQVDHRSSHPPESVQAENDDLFGTISQTHSAPGQAMTSSTGEADVAGLFADHSQSNVVRPPLPDEPRSSVREPHGDEILEGLVGLPDEAPETDEAYDSVIVSSPAGDQPTDLAELTSGSVEDIPVAQLAGSQVAKASSVHHERGQVFVESTVAENVFEIEDEVPLPLARRSQKLPIEIVLLGGLALTASVIMLLASLFAEQWLFGSWAHPIVSLGTAAIFGVMILGSIQLLRQITTRWFRVGTHLVALTIAVFFLVAPIVETAIPSSSTESDTSTESRDPWAGFFQEEESGTGPSQERGDSSFDTNRVLGGAILLMGYAGLTIYLNSWSFRRISGCSQERTSERFEL